MLKSFIDYGYVKSSDITLREYRELLDKSYYPSSSIFFAAKNAFSTNKSISSIEKAIIIK